MSGEVEAVRRRNESWHESGMCWKCDEAIAALEASRREVEALRAAAREVTEHFEDSEVDCEDCRLTRLTDGDDPCAMHASLADLRRTLALATEEGASE